MITRFQNSLLLALCRSKAGSKNKKPPNPKTLVMVPRLLYTLADQAHNTTSEQFTLFHEIHQQNLNVCMRNATKVFKSATHIQKTPKTNFLFCLLNL